MREIKEKKRESPCESGWLASFLRNFDTVETW